MSIELYFLNHLRLLALRHDWQRVQAACAAMEAALVGGKAADIREAVAALEQSLSSDPLPGPPQTLRQAHEHYEVLLQQLGLRRSTGAAAA